MYSTNPRSQRFIDSLPEEIHSPFLRRTVRLSEREARLAFIAKREPRRWTQRELADRCGYADPGGVSRALRMLARLGIIALRVLRGRYGGTLLWLRRGVRRLTPGLVRWPNVATTPEEPDTRLSQGEVVPSLGGVVATLGSLDRATLLAEWAAAMARPGR